MVTDAHVAGKYMNLLRKCKQQDIEFNLSLVDLRRVLNTTRCTYTGTKFDWNLKNEESLHPDYPTIDRVDPLKGYTKGNVVLCTYSINCKKGNLAIKELEQILKVMKRYK